MTNPTEALALYGELYGEDTAVIFGIARFTYAGHSIAVDLLQDGTEQDPNFFIHCRSFSAVEIEHGIYPTEFAEGEASSEINQFFELKGWTYITEAEATNLITDNYTGKGGTYEIVRNEVRSIVDRLIEDCVFGVAN